MRRREGPATLRRAQAPSARGAPPGGGRVLAALIGINVAVWLGWQQALQHEAWMALAREHLLVGGPGWASRPWTLLTSGFSHISSSHLLSNLLGLWVFGGAVGERYGGRSLLGLYLAGALVASVAHLAWNAASGGGAPALGASGAVMAIGAVYGCTFPRNVLLIGMVIPMPAWLAVLVWMGMDLAGLFGGGDGIAHAAHLGGAAWGLAWWASRRRHG